MIYDTIENARLYKGMNPHLDKAIEFMLTQDLDALPMGRTEIDGSNVFCNKMEAQTMPAEEKLFEMHRVYMDIQIDLQGSECIETGDVRQFSCPDFSYSLHPRNVVRTVAHDGEDFNYLLWL